jgi:general secretion pathway protein A
MYKGFFGLNRNPFELSPDPSFMCPLGRSEEAVASIYHAILRRKGFVVLTGEVGTGKTLVVRYLCELWKERRIPFANIIGPRLSVTDFLNYVAFDLGIKVTEPSKGNLLLALYIFLLAQFEKGLTTVLVIDEAHQIPLAVLEEIRRLSNFETAQEKLLQILLVGQPELDKKLDSFELRQLKQRIAIRCQLEPLGEEETRRYIERRLSLAGANSQANTIFPLETVGAIYRYSSGVPRLVNSICEQALVAAYARQVLVVPVEIIDDVASYFRLRPTPDLEQSEKLRSQVERTGNSVSELCPQPEPALDASAEKPVDPNAFWSHVKSSTAEPGQSTPPSKRETSFPSVSSWPQEDVQPSATPSLVADLTTIQTDRQGRATGVPNRNPGTDLSAAPPMATEPSAPITELRGGAQAVSENTSVIASASEKGQRSLVAAERPAKNSSDTRKLTAQLELGSPRAASWERSSVRPQSGMAVHSEEKPKPWKSRGLTAAGIVLLFILVGGGILLFPLGADRSAALKPTPVVAAPRMTTSVGENSAAQVAEPTQEFDPPEVRSARKSVAVKAGAPTATPRFEQSQLSVPEVPSALLDALNAHPILYHSEAHEIPTAPAVDPGAASLDDNRVLPLMLSFPPLAVPPPLDSATQEPH